ncbi:hypothetical protein ACFPYI_07860 [Halomarina salina]|uniref:Uncharacterized protein n=1 Tax=Halomarina salina TaxID=1872699 RepID=A0ABD5RM12_9EURY|nr:hypothetical protein [Halomarina salina]
MPPAPDDRPRDADQRGDDPSFPEALASAFDATDAEIRVVARQAQDLADSGRYRADTSHELTPGVVVTELGDAPDDGLPSKWNWWVGALDLAYGDYAEFRIQAYRSE